MDSEGKSSQRGMLNDSVCGLCHRILLCCLDMMITKHVFMNHQTINCWLFVIVFCRWVEFINKKVAKRVATMLNGEQIGTLLELVLQLSRSSLVFVAFCGLVYMIILHEP